MKIIKSLLTLLVLTVAFTTISCDNEPIDPVLSSGGSGGGSGSGSGSSGGGSSSGDYWPTALNNVWNMERDGVALDPIKIIGTGTFGGQTYYKFEPQSGAGNSTSGTVTNWLNKSNGVYKLKTDDIVINAGGLTGTQTGYEYIVLKDNLEAGGTWNGSYSQTTTYSGIPPIQMNTNYTGTILEKNVTATVNGETYSNVIKVRMLQNVSMMGAPATTVDSEFWYAKNVGIIKSTTTSAGVNYVSVLVDYTLF